MCIVLLPLSPSWYCWWVVNCLTTSFCCCLPHLLEPSHLAACLPELPESLAVELPSLIPYVCQLVPLSCLSRWCLMLELLLCLSLLCQLLLLSCWLKASSLCCESELLLALIMSLLLLLCLACLCPWCSELLLLLLLLWWVLFLPTHSSVLCSCLP